MGEPFSVKVEVEANVLCVRWGDTLVYVDPDQHMGVLSTVERCKRATDFYVDSSAWDDSPWFVFATEDCFDPPCYVVRARGWEAAYECFVDERSERGDLRVTEEDLQQMGPGAAAKWEHFDSHGNPVDTESVVGSEATFVMAMHCDGLRDARCKFHLPDQLGHCTSQCGKW